MSKKTETDWTFLLWLEELISAKLSLSLRLIQIY